MIGAILGDIIGSRFEFFPFLGKEFELFTDNNRFTDDTVLIIAIADAFMNNRDVEDSLKDWFGRYPNAGFGPRFTDWVINAKGKKTNSIGNGGVVRISALPFLCKTEEQLVAVVKQVTKVTHDSRQALVSSDLMARYAFNLKGSNTVHIPLHKPNRIPKLALSFEELWYQAQWSMTCFETVPISVVSFKRSNSFEDAIRNAVMFGVDSDTTAAMAGMLAEAYYGLIGFDAEHDIESVLDRYLPQDMLNIIKQYQLLTI